MSKNKLPVNDIHEPRAFSVPDIAIEPEGNIIQGHAAVFGQTTNICGRMYETIARGAFDKTDFTDVVFTINHNLINIPLAHSRNNTANSTLQLQVDDVGLDTKTDLDIENNADAKALYGSIQRGDINGMSFIFSVRQDEWTGLDTDMPSRTITDIAKVYEVSAVSFPAYDGTDINARSAETLESVKKVLENARAKALESGKTEQRNDEVEILKLKTQILMKG